MSTFGPLKETLRELAHTVIALSACKQSTMADVREEEPKLAAKKNSLSTYELPPLTAKNCTSRTYAKRASVTSRHCATSTTHMEGVNLRIKPFIASMNSINVIKGAKQ